MTKSIRGQLLQLTSLFFSSVIASAARDVSPLDKIYEARAAVVLEKFQPVTAPIEEYSVTVTSLEDSLKPKYWFWVDKTDTYSNKTKKMTSVRFFMSVDPSQLSPHVEVKKYTDSAFLVNFYCARGKCVRSVRQSDELLQYEDRSGWLFRDEESAKAVATQLTRMIAISIGKD